MKIAETVTFGGAGLDRAGELRGDAEGLAQALKADTSRTLVLWRGKPLLADHGQGGLMLLPMDHPIMRDASQARILMGRDVQGAYIFAVDLADWSPADVDETQMGSFLDRSLQSHPAAPEAAFTELRLAMASQLTPMEAELTAAAVANFNWHRSHMFCSKCGQPSQMALAGWQRNCASCGGEHYPRTDPVVIMLITRGNSVLMGRSHGWPAGMYSLLAGFVESGEPIEGAVRREVYEEARIKVGAVDYLASQPWPFPNSLMFGCHGEALDTDIVIDPKEIEDARWFTREEILASFAGQNPDLLPARKGAIAQFILRNWLADRLD